jgi:hypothetical protein
VILPDLDSRPFSMSAADYIPGHGCAAALRRELLVRNLEYARSNSLPHHESIGPSPAICYSACENSRAHGNFLQASYLAILKQENWRLRLQKPHTTARQAFPRDGLRRRELDSSTSSDALLMNIFCYPGTLRHPLLRKLLNIADEAQPQFGYKAKVPLTSGRCDRTEVDMRIGDLLVEAKLTESGFQKTFKKVIEGYRDFEEVFEASCLPQDSQFYFSYQLIRNVLAAYSSCGSFCLIIDERRPDMREAWYAVMRSIRALELQMRCRLLTWQELARFVPVKLQSFLREKYGISAQNLTNADYGL